MSKHMCIIPWIHMHPWPNGKTLLCCESPYEHSIGNLREQTLAEVWNSPKMRQVRLNMLNDAPSPECARCYEKERHGLESLRITSNRNWLERHSDKVSSTNPDGSLNDLHIVYLDFRFSNVCNLKCRYCGPELSSQWFKDAVKSSFNQTPTEQVIQIRRDLPSFISEFEPMLPYIEQIYWAGGEPLIMDEHWAIMNKLVELGRTDIRIFYNTNFTQLSYKGHSALDLWRKFKHISVGASLDASHLRGEYQRKGTDWTRVESNIRALREQCPDVDFYVSCTLSAYNAYHITDFHRYMVDKGYIQPSDWDVNILLNNERFRVSVLPDHHKAVIKAKWAKHLAWLRSRDNVGRATRGYEAALSFIDDDYSHKLGEFVAFNREFDSIRSEDFASVYPELRDLYE